MSLHRTLALSTLLLCTSAQAALDGQGRQEVDALLSFVERREACLAVYQFGR